MSFIYNHALLNKFNLKQFLKKYKDIDYRDSKKNTVLLSAACFGYTKIVNKLLKNGADPNKCNYQKSTPLMKVTIHPKISIIKLLMRYGADINKQNMNGNTALHISIEDYELTVYLMLLKYKPNLTIRNDNGKTPLYLLIKKNRISMTNILIDHIDKNYDKKEFYYFMGFLIIYAIKLKRQKIIQLLKNKLKFNIQNFYLNKIKIKYYDIKLNNGIYIYI